MRVNSDLYHGSNSASLFSEMSLWKVILLQVDIFITYLYTSNYNLVTACKVEINTGYSGMKKKERKMNY